MNTRNKLFLLPLVICTSFIFAQNSKSEIIIENERNILSLSNPYLPHSNTTNGKQGYSFVYNYPGFFGCFGQSSIYYTNSSGSSFYGGIGMGAEYLMGGMNIVIKSFALSKIFLNFNIGIVSDNDVNQLGSVGISYVIKCQDKINNIEISCDIYIHHGARDNFIFPVDAPHLRGIMANVHFNTELTENLLLNYSIGLSFIQYRYLEQNNIGDSRNDYRYYVTKYQEQEDLKSGFGRNPAWDSKFLIPFGISLSYHF